MVATHENIKNEVASVNVLEGFRTEMLYLAHKRTVVLLSMEFYQKKVAGLGINTYTILQNT